MLGGTATFTDPGDYQASVVGASINLVLTGGGDFDGRLTWMNLRRLRLVRGRETVPHIAFVKVPPETVLIAFPTSYERNEPRQLSRLRRLNLVRAALTRADPTITKVSELARRHGFSELGRFAVTYRTVFGETPSTTLRCSIKRL